MPKFDNEDALYAIAVTENMKGLVLEGNNHKIGRLLSLRNFLSEALNEVERLEEDLNDLHSGQNIVMPSSKGHAQNMELVAERWLKDNT